MAEKGAAVAGSQGAGMRISPGSYLRDVEIDMSVVARTTRTRLRSDERCRHGAVYGYHTGPAGGVGRFATRQAPGAEPRLRLKARLKASSDS